MCLRGLGMAQASTDSLWITPDKPQPGQTLVVHFVTGDASMAKAKQLEGGLYSIDKMNNIQGLDLDLVSLESLRGKTVVLDFWATWCGPCKRSMPAMQKIVDNHRNDSSVVLLFVDTMEHGDSTKQKVSDFIKNSPYTFHVLLDSNSTVSAGYMVAGIPTKLVIDPQGVLRFKVLGFNGDVDKTVDELETMIRIAGTQPHG